MKNQKVIINSFGNEKYEEYEIQKENEERKYASENTILPSVIFDATAANHLAKKSIQKNNEQQLNHVIDRIQSRAIDGHFDLYLNDILSSSVKEKLESMGFKIYDAASHYCSTLYLPPPYRTVINWESV